MSKRERQLTLEESVKVAKLVPNYKIFPVDMLYELLESNGFTMELWLKFRLMKNREIYYALTKPEFVSRIKWINYINKCVTLFLKYLPK